MNTKLRQRLLFCGSALLAGLGSLAFLLAPAKPSQADVPVAKAGPPHLEPADHAAAHAGARRTSDAPSGPGVYTAPVGTQLDFTLDSEATYAFTAEQGERTQPMGLRTKGTLTVRVARRQPGEIVVVARLAGLAWAVNGQPIASGEPTWARQRAATLTPVHLRLGEDGSVRGYRFDPTLDGEQRNLVRGLLAPFAFTVPVERADAWEATGADTTGLFTARCRGQDRPTGFWVRRTKLRYQEMAQDQDGVPQHSVEGAAEATFDRQIGWLVSATVDERLAVTLPGFDARLLTTQRGSLRLTSAAPATLDAEDVLPADAAFEPAAGHREDAGTHAAAEAQARQDAELRQLSLEEVLARLAALLASDPVDPKAVDEAWQQLAGCLRVDDRKVAEVQGRLARGEIEPRLAVAVVTALGAAGTDAAQATLEALRGSTQLAADLREAVCVAMLQLAHPKPTLLAALARDVEAARDLAGLDGSNLRLLGALASRSDGEDAPGQRAVDLLRGLETKARQTNGTACWLEALGNSGRPEVVGDVLRYVGDADPSVRRAAFTALRTLSGPRVVDTLLAKGLADSAAEARAESVLALAEHRDPRAADAVRRVARQDTDAGVRRAAIEAMANRRLTEADQRTLDEVARLDPDAQVRDMARRLLERR